MAYSQEYLNYIKSKAWQEKRREKLAQVGHKCHYVDSPIERRRPDGQLETVKCQGALQVHHKHYRTLGNEAMSDLEVYCQYHHERYHAGKSIKRSHWTR
jgi:hypothetical protein